MKSANRFFFLHLFTTWSRLLAALMAMGTVIFAFVNTRDGGFGFLGVLLVGMFYAWMVLLVADFLDCILAIEENTRTERRARSSGD
ncbi:MAG: hypothetical protein ACE5H3_01000 [Planctomycetota bacterium]